MSKGLFENRGDGGSACRRVVYGFEDLFHFGRVGGAGDCLFSADEALEIGVGDTVVHGLHSEFPAGLDDVCDFVDAVFADAVADSRGAKQYFGTRYHSRLVNATEQGL